VRDACCRGLQAAARLLERSAGLHVLRQIGWSGKSAIMLGLAAGLALPSVILMMLFGQTRVASS
jgi:APA family basic amino acid/polyamine antiporter